MLLWAMSFAVAAPLTVAGHVGSEIVLNDVLQNRVGLSTGIALEPDPRLAAEVTASLYPVFNGPEDLYLQTRGENSVVHNLTWVKAAIRAHGTGLDSDDGRRPPYQPCGGFGRGGGVIHRRRPRRSRRRWASQRGSDRPRGMSGAKPRVAGRNVAWSGGGAGPVRRDVVPRDGGGVAHEPNAAFRHGFTARAVAPRERGVTGERQVAACIRRRFLDFGAR